jgi:hypothetical protein
MRWPDARRSRRSSAILGAVSTPRRVPRQLAAVSARWLMVGLVIAGIVGMHVLSVQDPGEGHGMVMTPQSMESDWADGHGDLSAGPMVMSGAGAPGQATVAPSVAAGGNGMSGSMVMCLLFLGAGAAALALLVLHMRRADGPVRHPSRTGRGWGCLLRGPPGADPPRIALCVLRV